MIMLDGNPRTSSAVIATRKKSGHTADAAASATNSPTRANQLARSWRVRPNRIAASQVLALSAPAAITGTANKAPRSTWPGSLLRAGEARRRRELDAGRIGTDQVERQAALGVGELDEAAQRDVLEVGRAPGGERLQQQPVGGGVDLAPRVVRQ